MQRSRSISDRILFGMWPVPLALAVAAIAVIGGPSFQTLCAWWIFRAEILVCFWPWTLAGLVTLVLASALIWRHS